MEKFGEKITPPEKLPVFLNDWDKKYLEKGAIGMINKLRKDFSGGLPDIIILPERGARSLYYILNPLFKKLHEQENTAIPRFVFFSVGQKAGINLSIHEQHRDIRSSDELNHRLTEIYQDLPQETIRKIVAREKVEDVMISRKNMRERADEINAFLFEKEHSVAIIDETLSNGATVKEIRKAFENENIPAYTLIGSDLHDPSITPGYVFDTEIDPKNPDASGYSFSFENAEDAIGILKSPHLKYSVPIKKESLTEQQKMSRDKKLLRTEMQNLGNELAKKGLPANSVRY